MHVAATLCKNDPTLKDKLGLLAVFTDIGVCTETGESCRWFLAADYLSTRPRFLKLQ